MSRDTNSARLRALISTRFAARLTSVGPLVPVPVVAAAVLIPGAGVAFPTAFEVPVVPESERVSTLVAVNTRVASEKRD